MKLAFGKSGSQRTHYPFVDFYVNPCGNAFVWCIMSLYCPLCQIVTLWLGWFEFLAGPGWSGFGRVEGYDAVNAWFVFRNKLSFSRLFECKSRARQKLKRLKQLSNICYMPVWFMNNLFINCLSHKQSIMAVMRFSLCSRFSIKFLSRHVAMQLAIAWWIAIGSAPELRSVVCFVDRKMETDKTSEPTSELKSRWTSELLPRLRLFPSADPSQDRLPQSWHF